jgi:hypothetical protein
VLDRLLVEPGKAAGIAARGPRDSLLLAEQLAAELQRLDPRLVRA